MVGRLAVILGLGADQADRAVLIALKRRAGPTAPVSLQVWLLKKRRYLIAMIIMVKMPRHKSTFS